MPLTISELDANIELRLNAGSLPYQSFEDGDYIWQAWLSTFVPADLPVAIEYCSNLVRDGVSFDPDNRWHRAAVQCLASAGASTPDAFFQAGSRYLNDDQVAPFFLLAAPNVNQNQYYNWLRSVVSTHFDMLSDRIIIIICIGCCEAPSADALDILDLLSIHAATCARFTLFNDIAPYRNAISLAIGG